MNQLRKTTARSPLLFQAAADAIENADIPPIGIEAVCQAPSLQEEMILASMGDPNHLVYLETQHFTTGQILQAASLERAAHALAAKHTVLRTIFCWNEGGNNPREKPIAMVVLSTDYVREKVTFVEDHPSLNLESNGVNVGFQILGVVESRRWRGEMPWKISVTLLPDQQGSHVSLSYHQALLDLASACRLVRSLQSELSHPGSVKTQSDFFAVHKGQAYRRSRDMQTRLEESFSGISPVTLNFGDTTPKGKFEYGEKLCKVAARLEAGTGNPVVPPWVARLALFMSLCTFGNVQDAVFLELTSGRDHLPLVHRDVLGPVLVPQVRWASIGKQTSLYDVTQELKSENDISHAFSPRQIHSFFPKLAEMIEVCLICQTEESSPSSAAGPWVWNGASSASDIPLVIELMPTEHGSCLVSIRYHRYRFTENVIVEFQEFFCGMLDWLKEHEESLRIYTFAHAVEHVISVYPHIKGCVDLPKDDGGTCVHHLLEQHARQTPQKIALQYECSEYLTYKQLNDRCNEVADALIEWLDRIETVIPDEEIIIPLSFEKGFDMIVAIFAVLKAGCAYVAIDINHPVDRIASIIHRTKACAILCSDQNRIDKLQDFAETTGASVVTMNELTRMQSKGKPCTIKPARKVSGSSLAFVQTTSGTTGTPKGIMVEHRNLVALLQAEEEDYLGTWTTSRLQLANFTFDMAMGDILGTLTHGGRLILGPEAMMLSCLPEWLEKTSVTHLTTTPLIADLLESQFPAYLRVLLVGGEPFHPSLIQHNPTECRLYNGYGPSEGTIIATRYRVSPVDGIKSTVPIGQPFGSCRIYLLAPEGSEEAVVGETGEICIDGPQVTRGYLGQPELTDAKFMLSPFDDKSSAKIYRTGDIGRFLPDGTLEYLGRIDEQVKVRGQRVETLEIETLIGRNHGVKACAVVLGDSSHGGALVAFVETQIPSTNDANAIHGNWVRIMNAIKSHLDESLPDYMIPGHIIRVEKELPRLASNKLDRRDLTSRATAILEWELEDSQVLTEYVEPADEIEMKVCEAFSTVLSCRVGTSDNFLNLGGHSVTAIRAASRIRQQIRTNITFRDVLECLTPLSLSIRIRESGESTGYSSEVPHISHFEPVEQSFAQGRLWFVEQLHSNLSWYLLPLAFRVRGPLRLDALEAALLAIEKRHETLRTTFEERDGVNLQVVHPFSPRKIRILDIDTFAADREESLRDALLREQTTPFDLRIESGWRPAVLRINDEDHVISIVLHHIIADGWSLGVLLREVTFFYSAGIQGKDPMTRLPPLPIQYQEYSLWQRQDDQLKEQKRQLEYWNQQLQGSHPAEFICDKSRPPIPSGIADVREITIKNALYRDLQMFCRKTQVTPFIVLLAAFRAAHYCMTGAVDATIGTPITNRNREEHEGLIGLFVNMQCMRIRVLEGDSFEQLVQEVKNTATAAFAHNEVPFENIVSELQPTRVTSRNPLIQTVFAVHPEHLNRISLEGLDSEKIDLTHVTRFDLEFHFYQHDQGLDAELLFATDLFHYRTIETLLSAFHETLKKGLETPNIPIEDIPLRDGTSVLKAMGLIEVQRTDHPRDSSIVDLFRDQVATNPDAIAVKDTSFKWTYSILDQESDKIADWLSELELPAETIISVLSKRSCETVAAFLGVLKANMAYLPLEASFPAARIEAILSSIEGPRIVLLGSDIEPPIIRLDRLQIVPTRRVLSTDSRNNRAKANLSQPNASSLAYVIFTSGSTGQPKGVMIEHRAIVSRVRDSNFLDKTDATRTFLHMASIAFDAAVWEIYVPLLNGGAVMCIDTMTVLDFAALSNLVRKENVQVAFMTPALLRQFLSESPTAISQFHTLAVGGERSEPRDLIRASRLVHSQLIHVYGPTENSIFSTFHRLSENDEYHNGVPIGESLRNSGAYVMDKGLRLMQLGIMGELVVAGDGLARGYTDAKNDLNRFVWINIDGQVVRAYRTGDRARCRPTDGQIEFIGRLDGQVKIRGFRVETGEIEHALLESGLLDDAAVILQHSDNQEPQLVTFVTKRKTIRHEKEGLGQESTEEQNLEEAWRHIFSATTYDTNIEAHQIGRDFSGWKSMYDGTDIDKVEMDEWLDDTITALLNGGRPGHVLEIGTGSGMILFNVTDGLQSYVGLEPVQSMVDFVNKTVGNLKPCLAEKIQVHVGSASSLSSMNAQPDLVVVNSVAQYFPSADYLARLIEDLLRVHRAKTLFFGDMRSYALYDQFQVSKALHVCKEMPDLTDIRQSMVDTVESETELLVDPAFFTVLVEQFPDLIHHVEIMPKRMEATNELSCYRYSAVIHSIYQDLPQEIHTIDEDQWIDFGVHELDYDRVLDLLNQSSESAIVAISNIPHSKTILERLVVKSLSGLSEVTELDWISSIRDESNAVNALSAVDLVDIGARSIFHVEISWARQFSQHGGLDAIFHHIEPEKGRERTMFSFPTDHASRSARTFSNNPMQNQSGRGIEKRLKQMLQKSLPSYMVPAVVKVLDKMPINHNGKIDRRSLADLAANASPKQIESESTHAPPRDDLERIICEEFATVLRCEVGITDNFFNLGGHSLMATRTISLIVRRLRCTITVRDLFDCPTPGTLAKRISSTSNVIDPEKSKNNDTQVFANHSPMELDGWQDAVDAIGLRTDDIVQILPCTPFQEGVLTADLVLGETPAYQAIMRIEFDENIDLEMLQSAWQSTVEREKMLRTAFLPTTRALPGQGICSGTFLQAVLGSNSEEVVRVSTVRRLDAQGYNPPPDLGMGHIPVSLVVVPNETSGCCKLELMIHHALYDEAYLSSILEGLSHYYHQVNTVKDEYSCDDRTPFTSFVRMLQTTDRLEASSFWKEYLKNSPTSTWPIPGGLRGPLEGERIATAQTAEWRGNAVEVSNALKITPAGMARAAFALTIAAHSDSDDITWGEVSSGRSYPGFVAGPCIATHPVRIRLAANERKRITVDKLLRSSRDAYLDTIPHQHLGLQPIRQLAENTNLLPFQVLFVYQETFSKGPDQTKPWSSFRISDDELSHIDFPLVLEVSCHDESGHLSLRCVFDPSVLPSADVEWILQHVVDSLDMIAQRALSQHDGECFEARLMMTEHEQRILEQLSAGENAVPHETCLLSTVIDVFRWHATVAPEKIAIQVENTDYVTYQQLDDSSDRVASGLQKLLDSCAAETNTQQFIPIFFEKSAHLVTAILGILKTGAVFVPMDIQHPLQRLESICQATRARIIIWDGVNGSEKLRNLSEATGAILCTVISLIRDSSQASIQRRLPLDSLAYVLFTSGSTGTPKGVMVEHRSLASFALSNEGSTDCSWTSNRLALLASTFDASVGDLFATLSKGEELNITHLALTPTLGALMMNELRNDQRLYHLNTMVFGGEPFRASFLNQIPNDLTIWNGYGPTETTIEVAAYKLQGPDVGINNGRPFIPIGASTKHRRIYLLRPGTQEQVPIGSVGEMCIGGPQVARGYLGQPDLTVSQFIPDPFSSTRQGNMYRTGDMARLHGDGYLEYIGRIDGQIKLRGLRIDTNEICSVTQNHPRITACAVAMVQSNGGETLTAFVEVDQKAVLDNDISESVIKEHMARSVPDYMVPDCVWLQTTPLPRATSGKLDQRAIDKMAEIRYKEHRENLSTRVETRRAAPGSPEALIASLWAEVLGVKEDAIDITTTFSRMGGNSIRAIVLLALFRRERLHLSMKDLSQTSTVQSQAVKLREGEAVDGVPGYINLHVRQRSEATIVLVHPFLAQATVFEPLLPLLDESFDIILVDDPFVGTADCPQTLSEWANSYLHDIQAHIQLDRPIFFGGYSFGGLIAFEMALRWEKWCGSNPASVILLDPGTYRPEDIPFDDATKRDDTIRSSLGMAGMETTDMAPFEEHFAHHARALRMSRRPPVYQGRSLYLALPDRVRGGVVDWWRAQCSKMAMHILDCDNHYTLLKDHNLLRLIGRLINEHCHACIDEVWSPSSASSGSRISSGQTFVAYILALPSHNLPDFYPSTHQLDESHHQLQISSSPQSPFSSSLHLQTIPPSISKIPANMGQTPSTPQPNTKIQVIGAGLPRTGTASFSAALSILLDGPVYHGGTQITMGPPIEITSWITILRHWMTGKAEDRQKALALMERRLDGYAAITDAPGSQLFLELMELYPDATVIVTVRDSGTWEKSMGQIANLATLWFLRAVLLPLPGMRHFVEYIDTLKDQWDKLYTMYSGKRSHLDVWHRHIAWLKETVPEDRLVFFDVKEGWGPLCKALGKEVPKDIPFPRINDSDAIDQTAKYHIRRGLVRWMGIFATVGVVLTGLKLYW
ncbi:non-ribosomal peptide synthetase [Aspergillus ellipticus CBS 707.79]|uniref:Non-ribosomal peptide synthetase n=1 Tax=Aspergillus ellipticus CBS 707.79 TaxID=1448320 RepID=A0A319E0M3_9EURO|nr:non-ribosomal peptide synthetase [Aspergillus ellipticus CBS 707.79]